MAQITCRQKAYRHIREKILGGRLADEQRLCEVALAREIGISRTPVREALSQLASEGLLHRDRRGIVLRRVTRAELEETVRLRALLEVHAAGRAARLATPEHLTALRRAADQLRDISRRIRDGRMQPWVGEAGRQLAVTDMLFHRIVLDAAASPKVQKIVQDFSLLTTRYMDRSMMTLHRLARILREHWRIYRAIACGDPRAARRAMRRHAGNARRSLLTAYDRTQHLGESTSHVFDWSAALEQALTATAPPTPVPRARRVRGFTLVELLVVISIVALLVALLLPSLGKAKEASRRVVCATQLQQIGVAFHQYVQANRSWWPVCGSGFNNKPNNLVWARVLAAQMGVRYLTEQNMFTTEPPWSAQWVSQSVNREKPKDNGVFQCPTERAIGFKNAWGGDNACSYGFNSGYFKRYGMGHSDFDDPPEYPRRTRVQDGWIARPANTFVVADYIRADGWYEDATGQFSQNTLAATYHSGGGNYLWADAHVSALTPTQLLDEHFDRRH